MKSWFRKHIRRNKTDQPKKGLITLPGWLEWLIIITVIAGFIWLLLR
jgi:hypothetical protein